jgi:alkanesulfonate monooxygenase SsuD/methylene tetrahydromethanopterin reductase-like flavin-dependent oxidoreductase (luciferase family)
MLRRTCVCAREEDWIVPVRISAEYNRRFENLFRNVGTVENGFPEPAAWEQMADPEVYNPDRVRDGMVVGTPEQVVEKLQQYAAAGVDLFCYGASFGLPHDVAMRSLALFISKVMPHFISN